MRGEIAECILDHANGNLELRTDYSGRGMYGKTTHALVGDEEDFRAACVDFLEDAEEHLQEELEGVRKVLKSYRVDNMGLQYVFY